MDLNDAQTKVAEFVKENNLSSLLNVRVLDLVSEVGELAKEVLKGTSYGKNEFNITDEWTLEIGDILFALICVANSTEVNLEKCLLDVFEKYQGRLLKNGRIGS